MQDKQSIQEKKVLIQMCLFKYASALLITFKGEIQRVTFTATSYRIRAAASQRRANERIWKRTAREVQIKP